MGKFKIALQSDNNNWVGRCYQCINATPFDHAFVHVAGKHVKTLPEYAKFYFHRRVENQETIVKFEAFDKPGNFMKVKDGTDNILIDTIDAENTREAEFILNNIGGKYTFKSRVTNKFLARRNQYTLGRAYDNSLVADEANENELHAQFGLALIKS
jgi:hypothetical protein